MHCNPGPSNRPDISPDSRLRLTVRSIRGMNRHDRKLDPSAFALKKGYFMLRFTFLAGTGLLCVPATAAQKSKQPVIRCLMPRFGKNARNVI
jgi:hypothetical protein